jgi:hypothetical protein
MFQLRTIYTSAVRYSQKGLPTTIKKSPVTLRLSLVQPFRCDRDNPALFRFDSFEQIANFLAPKDFLADPSSMVAIQYDQVKDINPDVVYDLARRGC